MKCIGCITKPDVQAIQTTRYKKCQDCSRGAEHILCEECGKTLVLCTVVKYYHDGATLNDCGWFKQREKK